MQDRNTSGVWSKTPSSEESERPAREGQPYRRNEPATYSAAFVASVFTHSDILHALSLLQCNCSLRGWLVIHCGVCWRSFHAACDFRFSLSLSHFDPCVDPC